LFCPQIFYLITHLTNSPRFNRYFDIRCLQHFVDMGAMSVVAFSRTASGIALLCSFYSGSITLSNSIALPLKFNEKLLLEKEPTLRQTNFIIWIYSGKNNHFSPVDNCRGVETKTPGEAHPLVRTWMGRREPRCEVTTVAASVQLARSTQTRRGLPRFGPPGA